ncbi:Glutamate receptor 3.6, partial [Mucuna pruriens]
MLLDDFFYVKYNMSKVWLLVLVIFYSGLSSKGTSNVTTRPSAVNIGAILSFNSTIGRVAKVAIQAAVDDINSNATILNGTKLNISMLDTKLSTGFLGIIDCTSLSKHIPLFHFILLHVSPQKHILSR